MRILGAALADQQSPSTREHTGGNTDDGGHGCFRPSSQAAERTALVLRWAQHQHKSFISCQAYPVRPEPPSTSLRTGLSKGEHAFLSWLIQPRRHARDERAHRLGVLGVRGHLQVASQVLQCGLKMAEPLMD